MKRSGFLLMEFLISLTIITIIMALLSGLVGKLWIPALQSTQKQTTLINLMTAHDYFIRDIKMAKAEKKFWKKIEKHSLIFKSGWQDIGWVVEKNNVIRISGTYNSEKNEWNKKTKSLIIKSIDFLEFRTHGRQEIQDVLFTFRQNDQEIKGEVALINRTLPWKVPS